MTDEQPQPAEPIAAAMRRAGAYQMQGMSLTGSLALAAMDYSDELFEYFSGAQEGQE